MHATKKSSNGFKDTKHSYSLLPNIVLANTESKRKQYQRTEVKFFTTSLGFFILGFYCTIPWQKYFNSVANKDNCHKLHAPSNQLPTNRWINQPMHQPTEYLIELRARNKKWCKLVQLQKLQWDRKIIFHWHQSYYIIIICQFLIQLQLNTF